MLNISPSTLVVSYDHICSRGKPIIKLISQRTIETTVQSGSFGVTEYSQLSSSNVTIQFSSSFGIGVNALKESCKKSIYSFLLHYMCSHTSLHSSQVVQSGAKRKRKRLSNTSWCILCLCYLATIDQKKIRTTITRRTFSNRFCQVTKTKGAPTCAAHSLALPPGPALLNLYGDLSIQNVKK